MHSSFSSHFASSNPPTPRCGSTRRAPGWLDARGGRGAVIVAASRGAADDLARAVALARGGALGLHRFSFAQLAAHLAAPVLAARGIAPGDAHRRRSGRRARDVRGARTTASFDYFAPVAAHAGLPARAGAHAARARAGPRRPRRAAPRCRSAAPTSPRLLERFDEQFAAASATDRATLFEAAARSRRHVSRPAAAAARRADGVGGRVRARAPADRARRPDARHRPVRRPRHARSSRRRSASSPRCSSRRGAPT